MIISLISLWLLVSICMNMSACYIGISGLSISLLSVLIVSPILSWYILYNCVCISLSGLGSSLYSICGPFISVSNYSLNLSLEISIYEMIVIILLINISFIINIYILRYMYMDHSIMYFISCMMLFTFSMIVLILSSDSITLFIGWEMIGITSLLLIGYYSGRVESVRSGLKAIIYNRIGDVFLMLFVIMSLNIFNSNLICLYVLLINYSYYGFIYGSGSLLLMLGMSIIISAWSKSAQLGFQPWLLDAMEGPTPVSALLHSATLITAGVVLLYKFSYIFYYSSSLCLLIILLSGISCILNSLSSINYIDVKRIIAYSTCTHICLMILIISIDILIGISGVSILHLFYHGWSKSLIFLLAGYLISIFHSQDIRLFGSIYLQLPLLFSIINISLLTIYGFPGSSISGSKDIILEFGLISVYGSSLLIPMFVILLLSQGYSLGLLLYLLYNSSSSCSLHSLHNYYTKSISMSYYFSFIFVCLLIVYLPILLHDILLYIPIHLSHHVSSVDIFSLLSLLGLLLAYFHTTNSYSISLIMISNSRLLFDKLFSSLVSYISLNIIYYCSFILEYGFVMVCIHILNLSLLLLFLL